MENFSTPPSSNLESQTLNLANKISPNTVLIIVILAIILFISGLLHLLIRLLLRPTQSVPNDLEHVSVLQGQLQQLFHLHDSGVDQSYIDTLPLFYYQEIIGLKSNAIELLDPTTFDCVICLCEFESHDKLRLLPKCSHAFHMECIDTWLLSHSTCPLCRSSLLVDYCGGNNNPPIVCVLESNSSVENSREIERGRVSVSVSGLNPQNEIQFGSGHIELSRKSGEKLEEKILSVKLGKFRNVDVGEGSSENDKNVINNINKVSVGNNDLGSRRCYSMGSFAYILDETTLLQVPIKNTPIKKKISKKTRNRAIMSEYGCDSKREFISIDKLCGNGNDNEKSGFKLNNESEKSNRRPSVSISKIWEKNKNESSRRSNSEFEIDVSELGCDEETQSCYSVDSLANPTISTSSSNRRTLLWLMGRQNKIVHNHSTSLSSNV